MYEQKTKENDGDIREFLMSVENERQRGDALRLLEIFVNATGEAPKMWGGSIVGFGKYHYMYASGHEGEAPRVGFSPRKKALTVYLTGGLLDIEGLLAKLGKYKRGKGCIYIARLEEINTAVLGELIKKIYDNAEGRDGSGL